MTRGILGKALRGAAPVATAWAQMSYKEDMQTARDERLQELAETKLAESRTYAEAQEKEQRAYSEKEYDRRASKSGKDPLLAAAIKFTEKEIDIGLPEGVTAGDRFRFNYNDLKGKAPKGGAKIELPTKDELEGTSLFDWAKSFFAGPSTEEEKTKREPAPSKKPGGGRSAGFVEDAPTLPEIPYAGRAKPTKKGPEFERPFHPLYAPEGKKAPTTLDEALSVIDRASGGGGRKKGRPPSISEMDLFIDSIISDNPEMSEADVYNSILNRDTKRARSVYKRVQERLAALG